MPIKLIAKRNSYENREALKRLGFRFDPDGRHWYIYCFNQDRLQFLQERLDKRDVGWRVKKAESFETCSPQSLRPMPVDLGKSNMTPNGYRLAPKRK